MNQSEIKKYFSDEYVGRLFGGIKMTWKKVIIFAVCSGLYTALMAMLVPDSCSFHDIAVFLEAWVLFAIIIITNCEKPLEAALKTFVFFLISQPLVYLVQVPFNHLGWGIFGYYRYWFMVTLLTLPGAFIGWYIKKNNLLSGVILSVMLVLLAARGVGYFKQAAESFPNHLLSSVFCFLQIPLYIILILKNKYAKIIATAVSVITIIVSFAVGTAQPKLEMITAYNIDDAKYPVDSSWTAAVEDESISTAELFKMEEGDYYLRVTIYSYEPNTVILTDADGGEYRFTVSYEENYGLRVDEPDVSLP